MFDFLNDKAYKNNCIMNMLLTIECLLEYDQEFSIKINSKNIDSSFNYKFGEVELDINIDSLVTFEIDQNEEVSFLVFDDKDKPYGVNLNISKIISISIGKTLICLNLTARSNIKESTIEKSMSLFLNNKENKQFLKLKD